jgi:hypothetical protein
MFNESYQQLKKKYPWPDRKPKVPTYDDQLCHQCHDLLSNSLSKKTQLVIELGSCVGKSTQYILSQASNCTIVCIDVWDINRIPDMKNWDLPNNVLSNLYETFIVNCWEYKDRVIPVRQLTLDGLKEVHQFGYVPDLIYIDADHSYEAVKQDVELSYQLFPNAVFVGDDYYDAVPTVLHAVDDFVKEHNFTVEIIDYCWRIIK